MLIDESASDLVELESYPLGGENAGLYIKYKNGDFLKINIPRDCLAFQIGEAAQVSSMGRLVATPHLVRGMCSESIARNTFAVFMQVRKEVNW
jgi:isopenicillin N synthase-like dioxygenase